MSNNPIIIAVDTGNKCIKTPNETFIAGLSISDEAPPFKIDTIWMNGKCYTLDSNRVAYRKDKTEDDTYYMLTLFAIAKELTRMELDKEFNNEIVLAVGLPPKHMGQLGVKFKKYFLGNGQPVKFKYNGVIINIEIKNVFVYPQGLSAILECHDEIKKYLRSCVIDIGGKTTDIVVLENGQPKSVDDCYSLDWGLINLYSEVINKIETRYGTTISESQIDAIIKGEYNQPVADIETIIREEIDSFLEKLTAKLGEYKIDTMLSPCVFVGGGSVLLKNNIMKLKRIKNPIFIDDITANAKGYLVGTQLKYNQA